ncbi:hypothetical protein [Actinospongicola halichondriae]|uniref:hypothetical protein n=1 Tax=Actinospongicola halichondriae TaxID=3236844 RepID=UPI003D4FE928
MRRNLVIVLAVVAMMAVAPAAASPAAPAPPTSVSVPAQVDSLVVDAVTTYRLEPEAAVVRVTVEATLTNTAPSRRRGNYIETPYFDSFGVAAIGPVAAAGATRDGRALTTSVEQADGGDVEFVVVDLSPNLVYGSPQHIVVRYDIPAQRSRSEFATRINDAFASWYVVGTGGSGQIDVIVDVPERFEVDFTQFVAHQTSVDGGRAIHRFEDLDETESFFAASARDDAALVKRPTSVDDDDFEIHAWPGDEEWADFAVDAVDRGVPVLAARTGIDLAGQREITIAETATPYLYGYAGWYLPLENRIEIGDELDLQVMLHELSHLWFNGDLFSDRWINEGLADVVSNDIVRSFGEEPHEVEPIDPDAPGAQPLNDWENPGADDDAEAIENYGYSTSYAVMQAIFEEIGADGLKSLVMHADADLLAYLGDPDPEESFGVSDWRYLYDVAEHVVGSEELAGLFDDHVLTDDDRAEVVERAAALERYTALEEAGDGWSPPLEVRRRMGSWDFTRAADSFDDAQAALEARAALDDVLAPSAIDIPSALEDAYESASDLDDALELTAAVDAVAPKVLEADAAVDDAGPLEVIGLIGSSAGADRDAALAAFDAGDVDEAERLADATISTTDGATIAGALRSLAALVATALVVALVRRIRRRRSAVEEGDRLVEHPGDLGSDLGAVDEALGEVDPEVDRS